MNKIKYNPVNKDGITTPTAKYLPREIFEKCFIKGKTTRVDKTITGNGFSHSFLTTTPKEGTISILVAPNREVVFSKEKSYHSDKFTYQDKTQFFCSGSGDDTLDKNTKIIVTTTDSLFGLALRDGLEYADIDRILIDEAHSTIQQSLFRNELKGFLGRVEKRFGGKDVSITTVTATPILFSKVDITLIPTQYEREYHITVDNDYPKVIQEIKDYRLEGEKIIVFTNSSTVISNFIEKDRLGKPFLNARLMVGNTLLDKQVSQANVTTDDDFIIGSSTSFEGWDCLDEDVRVYFFQDFRRREESGFTFGNIYQAINRTRRGYLEATYCSLSTKATILSIEDVITSVTSSKIGNRRYGSKTAMSSIKGLKVGDYNRFKGLLVESKNKFGGYYSIDYDIVNYEKEQELMANVGIEADEYKDFRTNRNIIINNKNIMQKHTKKKVTRNLEWCIYNNRAIIQENKLNEKDFIFNYRKKFTGDVAKDRADMMKEFKRQFSKHIAYVNYDAYEYPERDYRTFKQKELCTLLEAEEGERTLLMDSIEEMINEYIDKKKSELKGLRTSRNKEQMDELSKKMEAYEKWGFLNILNMFSRLVNESPKFAENFVDNRDYNLLTKVKMSHIKRIGEMLGVSVKEYDISSCAVRSIYANAGLQLPDDFYGNNKKNKIGINTILNKLSKDSNKGSLEDKKYKYKLKVKLKEYNFDQKVIDYLLDTFFNEHTGAVFYVYTRMEQQICREVNRNFFANQGIRRHDSLIVFDSMFNGDGLSDYEFAGVTGWFKQSEINGEISFEVVEKDDFVELTNDGQFKMF